MTIYLRKVSEIADGSVTEAKLANLSISTGKLQDNAVTLAKAIQALKIHHFLGDENEVSVEGTDESEEKTFKFVKSSSDTKGFQPTKLHVNAEIKTNNASYTGTLYVYIDEEETPRLTVTTTSTVYEMKEDDADISDLDNGSHEAHRISTKR